MNHTFADWNTTILFDDIYIERGCNDDNNTVYIVVDKNSNEYIVILNDDACYSINDYVTDYGYSDSRKAISWEDIRLYLKNKDYEILINSAALSYMAIIRGKVAIILTDFNSYEEARFEAIKYCLQLIKQS